MFPTRLMNCTLLQRALCLLLCVSAWRGPVPMLHHHGLLTDPAVRDLHCQLLHSGNCSEECSGLHWHFAMPKDVNGKPTSSSEDTSPELAVFAVAAAVQQMEGGDCSSITDLLANMFEALPGSVVRSSHHGATSVKAIPPTVFASLLGDVPSMAVTGVCLV